MTHHCNFPKKKYNNNNNDSDNDDDQRYDRKNSNVSINHIFNR